jgi:hypothetical protein
VEARAPNAVVGEVVAAACAGEKQQREAALAGVHAEFMARLLAEARAREVRRCAATKKTNSRGSSRGSSRARQLARRGRLDHAMRRDASTQPLRSRTHSSTRTNELSWYASCYTDGGVR